jgi:hypothetical protein
MRHLAAIAASAVGITVLAAGVLAAPDGTWPAQQAPAHNHSPASMSITGSAP